MARHTSKDHKNKEQLIAGNNAKRQSNGAGTKQLRAVPVLVERQSGNGVAESAAVTQLIKKGSPFGKILKKEGKDMLATVTKWQGDNLTDMQVQDLHNANVLEYAMKNLTAAEISVQDDVVGWVSTQRRGEPRAESKAPVVTAPRRTIVDDLMDAGVERIYAELISAKDTEQNLRVFLRGNPANKLQILQCASFSVNTLASVAGMMATNAGRYPILTILEWGGLHGTAATTAALRETATHEISTAYIESLLRNKILVLESQFKQLLRFQCLLPGAQLVLDPTVRFPHGKSDKPYGGKEEDRTGFLIYTFSDGAIMRIHTHWNITDKVIISMHVQDLNGANGIEFNRQARFAAAKAAVVVGQNGCGPTGGPLT